MDIFETIYADNPFSIDYNNTHTTKMKQKIEFISGEYKCRIVVLNSINRLPSNLTLSDYLDLEWSNIEVLPPKLKLYSSIFFRNEFTILIPKDTIISGLRYGNYNYIT